MKTIIIKDKKLHDKLKDYCLKKNLKLGGFVEKLIDDFLKDK